MERKDEANWLAALAKYEFDPVRQAVRVRKDKAKRLSAVAKRWEILAKLSNSELAALVYDEIYVCAPMWTLKRDIVFEVIVRLEKADKEREREAS